MKKRDYGDYLQDILDSIDDLSNFTNNMSFKSFVSDKKTINAVTRSIEIIGEATKKLPASITTKYPLVPWAKMAGIRNKLIHEYFGIDAEILWKVVKDDLPPLKPLVEQALKELDSN